MGIKQHKTHSSAEPARPTPRMSEIKTQSHSYPISANHLVYLCIHICITLYYLHIYIYVSSFYNKEIPLVTLRSWTMGNIAIAKKNAPLAPGFCRARWCGLRYGTTVVGRQGRCTPKVPAAPLSPASDGQAADRCGG